MKPSWPCSEQGDDRMLQALRNPGENPVSQKMGTGGGGYAGSESTDRQYTLYTSTNIPIKTVTTTSEVI